MTTSGVPSIGLFKIAGRSISGWIPRLKTGKPRQVRQPFSSQLEERLLMYLEYHLQPEAFQFRLLEFMQTNIRAMPNLAHEIRGMAAESDQTLTFELHATGTMTGPMARWKFQDSTGEIVAPLLRSVVRGTGKGRLKR